MNKPSTFHSYFRKDLTWFFYAMVTLGLVGNILDVLTLGVNWNVIFSYYNFVTICILITTMLLFNFKKINLKLAFTIALYSIYINLLASNITDIILGQEYAQYLLRETIFVCFLVTSAFVFVDQLHGTILGISFAIYFTISGITSHDAFIMANIFNILAIFVSYVISMGFFNKFITKTLVQIQEDTFLIKEQNEDFLVVNQELTAVNAELHETQRQINAQHEELLTLSESISDQNVTLEEKNSKLNDAIEQKTKFFSIIAHDLKSPISSTTSLAEMMLERFDVMDEEKKKDWLSKILNSNKLLYELLENLLVWSQSQAGLIELKPEPIKLDETIDKICSIYHNFSTTKSVHLVRDLQSDVEVFADRMMLETILRNLISNAIKYSYENSEVLITASTNEKNIIVKVKDNGVGLNDNQLSNLFNSNNVRVSVGTSGEKGTGLGLRISKEFIEKHHGRISVESNVCKGSTFSFSLPRTITSMPS